MLLFLLGFSQAKRSYPPCFSPMALLLLLSSIFLAFLLSQCFSLYRSYQNARTLGLPIVISPVNPRNILWQLFQPRIQPFLRLLPDSLIQFAIISNPTWSFRDKAAVHQRLGPALVLVCPGINHIWVADPDAATTILTKRKEFPKPNLYSKLDQRLRWWSTLIYYRYVKRFRSKRRHSKLLPNVASLMTWS